MIIDTQDVELVKHFLFNPQIHALLNENDPALQNAETFSLSPNVNYLVFFNSSEPISMLVLVPFSPTTVEGHINTLPQYWGKPESKHALAEFGEYVKHNTKYENIITWVPTQCKQVIHMLYSVGASLTGTLKKGTIYQKKVSDLLLLTYPIRRG